MRPWQSTHPAKVVEVLSSHEIIFDVNLGWGITLRQAIGLEYKNDYCASQKIFIKRRLENLLSNAKDIMIDMFWSEGEIPFCDILIGGEDIIDLIERQRVLPFS